MLRGHDLVIDALDNIPTRLLLEKQTETLNIPLIHGAIQGWLAQVAVVKPGDGLLKKIYGAGPSSAPSPNPAPVFTPALCASLQVAEAVKLLCGKETPARGRLLLFDLYDNSINTIDLGYMKLQGRVAKLTRYAKHGVPGETLQKVRLIEGLGMEGDSHAKGGDRQLSLLLNEDRQQMETQAEQGLCFARYKENILLDEITPNTLTPGIRLTMGEAVLEISDTGRHCFNECPLFNEGRFCFLAGRKLFAKVIQSGCVRIGDTVKKEAP